MAQPKNKRRRKRRGTQGGRIDTNRRSRPRTREEAKARARSGGAKRSSASTKRDLPPTWKGSVLKGGAFALIFFLIMWIAFKRPLGVALVFGLFMLVFYIPTSYYIDMYSWRKRERQKIRDREGT